MRRFLLLRLEDLGDVRDGAGTHGNALLLSHKGQKWLRGCLRGWLGFGLLCWGASRVPACLHAAEGEG